MIFFSIFIQIKNIQNENAAAAIAAVLNFVEAFACKFQSVGFHHVQIQTITPFLPSFDVDICIQSCHRCFSITKPNTPYAFKPHT